MFQSKKCGLALLLLSSELLFFVHCSDRTPSDVSSSYNLSDPEKRIHIIIRIEDTYYFNADFEAYLQRLVGDECRTLDRVPLSRLLDSFIEDKMLLAAADRIDLSVSWQEQKRYLAETSNASQLDGTEGPLDDEEAQSLLERALIEKYIYEAVKDIAVEQDEISDYYEQNKRDFLRPERVSVSQILLDSEEKAVEIYERVNGSSHDLFQQIAKDVSLGIEAPNGGHLGIFEMSQLPVEMEKVIFSLKEGETSQVVESAYGFHIFRLDEKLEPKLEELEDVSTDIRIKILDQKIKQFVREHLIELKNTMDWEFFPKNLSFPYQRKTNE